MALIQDSVKHMNKELLVKNYQEAKNDVAFQKMVKRLGIRDEEAMKLTSKLQDAILEMRQCQDCEGLYMCKNSLRGHIVFPEKKENRIYFSYTPCKFQKAFLHAMAQKENRANLHLQARMKDIDMTGDKKRMEVIKWIDHFVSEYDFQKDMKGLYLHGSFGSGKTFLMSALLHELEIEKHASVSICYVPEVLRTLKDDWEMYESKIRQFQRVDLLLLDDIGAEKVTEWGRDEVIGTILQYRMDHHLPTFFTSNMNLKELESHLANSSKSIDELKARRIIERIKQLAMPMELISENRRR